MLGNREDIDWLIGEVRKGFNVKVEGGLNDFLGCAILREEGEDECYILQPHLVNKMVNTFGELLKGKRSTHTPGTPRKNQMIPTEEKDVVT